MARISPNSDMVTALRQVIKDGGLHIKACTQLVKIGNLQFRSYLDGPFCGLKLAKQNLEQRSFPRPITTNQADAVTTLHLIAEVADDIIFSSLKTLRNMRKLNNTLTTTLTGINA